MNSSKASSASSFDAGDYYKQLTSCLAAKNKLKVNMNAIPGYKNHLNNRPANRQPLITRQHIQAKFLAKCNARKLAAEQANKNTSSGLSNDGSKQSIEKKAKPALAFVLKGNVDRKKQDDFINLPDSFFKSFRPEDIPDLPIFKAPLAPVKAKQATPVDNFSVPEQLPIANQSNMSIITVTSAYFKPKLGSTSTPHELPRPIISDPADLGNYFTNPKPILSAPVRTFRDKAKTFFEAFGKVAEKIDTNCLSKYPEPLREIRGRLFEIYLESCKQPRIINETLMTDSSVREVEKIEQPHPPSTYVLPVPIFYDIEEKDKDVAMELDPLSETAKLFNFTVMPKNTKIHLETPAPEGDEDLWGDLTFDKAPLYTPAALAKRHLDPGWTNMTEAMPSPQSQMSETDWLFAAPNSMETDDIFFDVWNRRPTASPHEIDNTFALFTSPPKPGRRNSQRSQREENKRSRDFQLEMHESQPEDFSFLEPTQKSRGRDPSQRSQREDLRRSQLQDSNIILDGYRRRDSSLSTYRWSPNVGSTSFQTQSSRSQHYPFERRNMLKTSFNFR